jgi:hypothetical protein
MTPTSNRCWPESSARPPCWPCGACRCCGASANQPWLTCASSASRSAWARRSRAAGARGASSNGSSASAWPTGWRATSSACAPRWRCSAAASSRPGARVDSPGPRPAARRAPRPARPRPHRPDPRPRPVPRPRPRHRPPRPPPAPPPRHHPRPRPPTMTVPPVPRRRPDLVPRGPSSVVPDHQTQRAHPCRCPCGAPACCPPSVTRRDTLRPFRNSAPGYFRNARSACCDARGRLAVHQRVVERPALRVFAAVMDEQGDDGLARHQSGRADAATRFAHRMPAGTLMCRMSHHEQCENLAAHGPSRA